MNKSVHNRYLIVLLAIAVFIPSVVAVVSYNRDKNGPVNTKSVVSMTMSDTDGNKYEFKRDVEAEQRVIQMFLDINSTSTEIGQLPDPLSGKPFYLVVMSNGATDSSYQYYFDSASTDAYYMNSDGKAFKINETAAASFLKTSYAASVYTDAKIPTLTLAGEEDSVKPSLASWFYKDFSGEFSPRNCSYFTTSDNAEYSASGNIALDFDIQPDYLFVTVKDASDGRVMFDDLYENISNLKFADAAKVSVSVSGKWYESEEKGYYGELNYSFSAEIAAPAEFHLGVDKINAGEFVSVTAKNVKDVSKITFVSEPALDSAPVFYKNDDKAIALIPVPAGKPAGTYKFTFTYGGASQSLNLTVNEKTYRASTYNADASRAALYSDENKKAFGDALGAVLAKGSETRYFSGSFGKVFEDNSINRYYGRMYTVSGTNTVFREEGLEYKAALGTDVKVCAKGEVVFAGETAITGNTVIVEHGYGLKTMYAHLSSASVSVGDVIESGAVVGKCGSTGFTNTDGVYFSMFVGSTRVCPYATWADGDWKGVPIFE